ncbi:amino acid adenylation domain-containing protein [Nocardia sp. NPDC020380]|uniref:amino acid adenylation domain-containing protein n=1 Tax=Nocardia sp. NPDC020380 TaxID=3364309 RepID=UPI00379705A1
MQKDASVAGRTVKERVRGRSVRTRRARVTKLPRLLALAAENDPDGIAVALCGEVLRYRELDGDSSRLARLLIRREIGPGDLVAITGEVSIDSVTAMWAVAKTGAGFVVDDSNTVAAQTVLSLAAGSAPSGPGAWLRMDSPEFRDELAEFSDEPVTYEDRLRPIEPEDIAYVHGPAGVIVTQAEVAAQGVRRAARTLPESIAEFLRTVFPCTAYLGPHTTLAELFDRVAHAVPDATAVRFGDRGLTYRELDILSNRLARKLIALGARPETLVAVALPRSLELVVALLATVKSGSGYLPVDPAYPAERIAYLLADAEPVCAITDSGTGLPITAPVVDVHDADLADFDDSPITDADRSAALLPGNLAYVIYTSGSMGRPKGVQIPHRNVVTLLANTQRQFGFDHRDVWTMFHSYAFDFSVWELWGGLLHGGTVVVVDYETSRSPEQFLELLRTERVTVLNQTPSAFYQLAEADRRAAEIPGLTPLSLLYIVFGGEALDNGRLADWRARHGEGGAELVNMYGITETTVHTTQHRITTTGRTGIGSAIPGLRILLLDERMKPVAAGVPGEIYVAGAQLARGYLGRSALTAGRFVANPFDVHGSRLYRSGDLAKWDAAGNLQYLGRADDQVKVRGFRIELGEIESALLAVESVRNAAVVVREDTPGDQRIVAYLVGQPDCAALRAESARTLPEFMVPSAFVVLDAIPLTAHGKLDRRALPAPVVETAAFRAPTHPVQQLVAGAFAEVLCVERIGLDDNFFALGGNSLLATRVASLVSTALGTRIPGRLVFEEPTVAALAAAAMRHASTGGRPALVAGPRPDPVPLSMAQQRMWFVNRFDTASAAYNVPVAVRLTGELDVTALQCAVADLILRHETLRTLYPQRDGIAHQVILPAGQAVPDLTPQPVTADALAPRIAGLVSAGFDVTTEVPVRAELLRLTGTETAEHVLVLVAHHICCDGWSMGPLTRDVMVAYASRAAGAAPQWAPLPVQYADFSVWQRDALGSDADPDSPLSQQARYWRSALAGAPAELGLPADRLRPAVSSFRGGRVPFSIDAEVRRGLGEIAREQNATLFMVVHTAFAVLLARLSGTTDIVLGAPAAVRDDPALDGVIGMLVNTLVLRTEIPPALSFTELLARVRETDLQAYAHADMPFERLVELLEPERSTARNPLFQVSLTLQNLPESTFELPGLRVGAVDFAIETEQFDLSLTLSESGGEAGGMDALFTFARDLFDEATVRGFAERFTRLLAAVTAAPHTPVGDLPLLDAAEYALLTDVQGSPSTIDGLLPDLLTRGARLVPEQIAVRYRDRSITYRELDEYSSRLARHLIGRDIGPESLVALAFPRSYDMVAAVLAVAKTGAAYVPVDPAYPQDRVRHMVTDAGAALGLTAAAHLAQLPGELDWLALDDPATENNCAALSAAPVTDADRRAPLDPRHPAYLIYTSGSTGKPKGVTVTHAGLGGLLDYVIDAYRLEPHHRMLHICSPSFDQSIEEWLCAFSTGATLVIAAPEVLGGAELDSLLRSEGVTHTVLTPGLLGTLDPTGLGALELISAGGDVTTPDLLTAWQPGRRYYNGYGPTEMTIGATYTTLVAGQPITIGRPIPGRSALVLDSRLRPVPPGVAGELYLTGAAMARGYHDRAGLTSQRFVACPWGAPGARIYRTGDLARWVTGPQGLELEYLGRTDFQVKIHGFRIELGEIDAVLGGHDDVDFVTTLGRETADGATVLVSYVRAAAGHALDPDQLREHAARGLPRHMVPAAIVVLDEIPLTPVGKLDRKALPEPVFEAATFRAPSTPAEQLVAEVFAQILGRERVGADDDFFALGGTSLLTFPLQQALTDRLGLALPVAALFRTSTVRGLAALATGDDAPSEGPAPLLADAVLEPGITGPGPRRMRDVLLTGATGFVGAYLLRELLDRTDAQVWCLVRADSAGHGRDRIRAALRSYELWDESFEARIVPVSGDLAAPAFGLTDTEYARLADRIDAIYHNGARVNHLEPYSRLRAANVEGTREVLRLATTRQIKPVHFVSSANTVISTTSGQLRVHEGTRIGADELPEHGYIASKWVAEQLILQAGERGVPVRIYRPGLVSGDLRIGRNSPDDSFWNMIRAAAILGAAPDIGAATMDLVPVTYVASAIVAISLGTATDIEYHLVNEKPVAVREVFESLARHGLPIRTETVETIQLRFAEEARLRAAAGDDSLVRAALVSGSFGGGAEIVLDDTNARRALAGCGIACPPIDHAVLDTYVRAFLASEFLPSPPVASM